MWSRVNHCQQTIVHKSLLSKFRSKLRIHLVSYPQKESRYRCYMVSLTRKWKTSNIWLQYPSLLYLKNWGLKNSGDFISGSNNFWDRLSYYWSKLGSAIFWAHFQSFFRSWSTSFNKIHIWGLWKRKNCSKKR